MPDATASLAIEMEDVYKTYRLHRRPLDGLLERIGLALFVKDEGREFDALQGVSLRVPRGERLGIVGRNGAGKTTLLKLITGNFAPTRGRVVVNGSVQALMQVGLGFHPSFTGYENARSALHYNGLSGAALDDALADVVEFCELGEFMHQPVFTYSLGMGARLQFAAATAIRPEILIIDEIMGAGDAYFSAKSADRMKRLARSGCTLLLVSHSPQQVLEFCDSAIWLDKGEIVKRGPTQEVVGAYEANIENLNALEDSHQRAPSTGPTGSDDPAGGSKVVLEDGRKVFRWAGKSGIKVARIRLSDGEQEIASAAVGGSVRLEMMLRVERDAEYLCRYIVTLYDEEMRRVARVDSVDDGFDGRAGDVRAILVDISPFMLKAGSYSFSISIYDRLAKGPTSTETRFDVLARCLQLAVTGEKTKPLFDHPATWAFG